MRIKIRQKMGIRVPFFMMSRLLDMQTIIGRTRIICVLEVRKFIDKIGEVEERKVEERSSN